MIELMHQDTEPLIVCEVCEELWVVEHDELCSLFVNHHTSGGDCPTFHFVNTARQPSKERLRLKQLKSVLVQIKWVFIFVSHKDLQGFGLYYNVSR